MIRNNEAVSLHEPGDCCMRESRIGMAPCAVISPMSGVAANDPGARIDGDLC
jgi:hypothetical protein